MARHKPWLAPHYQLKKTWSETMSQVESKKERASKQGIILPAKREDCHVKRTGKLMEIIDKLTMFLHSPWQIIYKAASRSFSASFLGQQLLPKTLLDTNLRWLDL